MIEPAVTTSDSTSSPETPVTADVYDMANLEAHRRIAAARKVHREKK